MQVLLISMVGVQLSTQSTDTLNVICTSWGRGLKEEKLKHGSVNFKLAGSPWLRSGKGTIETRVFVCKMVEALMGVGWKLQLALDLSIRVVDKCSLAFQRCVDKNLLQLS